MPSVNRAMKYLFIFVFVVTAFPVVSCAQHYTQTNLVSDLPGQPTRDANLVNPWGLARSSTSPWWVANNGTGTSTLYNGSGTEFPPGTPLVVTVPPPKNAPAGTLSTPTGMVFNGSQDFAVAAGKPAIFIFVTEDGTISGWNPGADPTHAILMVDNSGKAVYKGVAIAEHQGKRFLYVANFKTGRLEVYDASFKRVRAFDDAFGDADDDKGDDRHGDHSQGDFAPFNVQNVGGNLVVAYAKQGPTGDELHGPGLGFVSIFSPGGRLLARLEHGSWCDAPWGIALAPRDFGVFSNSLLIGNFGSGKIAAFNPATFQFRGFLKNPDDTPIVISGLWSIQFGNSGNAGPFNSLFFTAGINDEADGLFGTLTAVAAEQDGSVL